jgi:cell division control protein 6
MEIFTDKKFLDIKYIPTEELLVHRKEEKISLKPVFKNFGNSQQIIFCFGFAGTGKTSLARFLASIPREDTTEKIMYINTRDHFTELQVWQEIMYQLKTPVRSRFLGEYIRAFEQVISLLKIKPLIILDEIDVVLEKSGENLLYVLSDKGISLILITNDATCFKNLQERTKSRLGFRTIIFNPYNANEINDILLKRAEVAFHEGICKSEVLKSTINYISALIAQESGDVRKAISLLKLCAEMAEEKGTEIRREYVETAMEKSEEQIVAEIIDKLPIQAKLLLFAITQLYDEGEREFKMSEISSRYNKLADINHMRKMTERRILDIGWELEQVGVVKARITTKRFGKERILSLCIPSIIVNGLLLKENFRFKPKEELYGKWQ